MFRNFYYSESQWGFLAQDPGTLALALALALALTMLNSIRQRFGPL